MLVADPPKLEYSLWRRALRVTIAVVGCVIIGTGLATYSWLNSLGVFNLDHRKIDTLTNFNYQNNSLVFDRNGAKIGEFFERYHVFVPHTKLPKHFIDALIAIEDRSFYEHHGVDYKGIARALLIRLKSGQARQGASTLTQQLIRNTILTPEKSLDRKVLEIAWALEAERYIPKDKILEIYTNSIFLGNGAYGVGAAAQRYFGKSIEDTTPEESALIAGLFQSPSRFNPAKYPERAKTRQIQVINAMRKTGVITHAQATAMRAAPLHYHPYKFMNEGSTAWFVDYIQETLPKLPGFEIKNTKQTGLRIYTTLDNSLQALAQRSISVYDSRLNDLRTKVGMVPDSINGGNKKATIEASMLVTDPRTGDILAMIGGRDYAKSQFNRTENALRSPGSAFKPIVYAQALMQGYKWSDVIYVSPVNIDNYRPRNLEDDYLTETTMMRAFYKSMNAPTMEITAKVGLQSITALARKMGIQSSIKDEFGSALGSSDVTMTDLARVYGTFAAGGILTELSPISKITTADGTVVWQRKTIVQRQTRVLNSQISYLMTQGMRAVLTSGTGFKSSDLAAYAAGKTGTSNNSSDNWFCGYTADLVSVVWVGTDEHAPIYGNATGGSVALPIWDQFIRGSTSYRPAREFYRPDRIVEATVHPVYGHRTPSGARMYFLSNDQPKETESALETMENSSTGGYRHVFRH